MEDKQLVLSAHVVLNTLSKMHVVCHEQSSPVVLQIPLAEQLNLATRLYRAAVLAFRCQPEAHRLVSSPSFIKVANHRACVVQINRHDVHRLLL